MKNWLVTFKAINPYCRAVYDHNERVMRIETCIDDGRIMMQELIAAYPGIDRTYRWDRPVKVGEIMSAYLPESWTDPDNYMHPRFLFEGTDGDAMMFALQHSEYVLRVREYDA